MGKLEMVVVQENSAKERERELMQKMLETQFEYGIRLMRKEIKFLDGEYANINGFEDVVKNWTRVPLEIYNAYCKRTGEDGEKLKEDKVYKDIFDKIISEICVQFEKGYSLEILSSKSFDIIFDIINTLPAAPECLGEQSKEAGVLEYNVRKPDEEEVKQYGLDSSADYVDIHFAALFKQQAMSGKEHLTRANLEEEIKKSCRQLSLAIEKIYPDVAGVMCVSWLIDTDWFVSAVGFNKEESILANNKTGFTKENSFWGQFISADGKLKKEKAQAIINGQKPKYRTKFNFISRKRFLEIHSML